ncbi:MAG: helix-turn-helix domain-containing protein [Cryobacterium sp.]|nr:helix-turn-helix domain-containing protein [Cryobacterium sp.]
MLGATRESTSRIMADFAARNLIRQGRGRIVIQDPAALHGVARRTA